MIGCLRTHVHKQPIIALYLEFENDLKFKTLGQAAVSFRVSAYEREACWQSYDITFCWPFGYNFYYLETGGYLENENNF